MTSTVTVIKAIKAHIQMFRTVYEFTLLYFILGTKKMSLFDTDYYRKYQAEKIKTGLTSAVDSFQILDNRTVLSTHDDFIVRVFDLSNGRLYNYFPAETCH